MISVHDLRIVLLIVLFFVALSVVMLWYGRGLDSVIGFIAVRVAVFAGIVLMFPVLLVVSIWDPAAAAEATLMLTKEFMRRQARKSSSTKLQKQA